MLLLQDVRDSVTEQCCEAAMVINPPPCFASLDIYVCLQLLLQLAV